MEATVKFRLPSSSDRGYFKYLKLQSKFLAVLSTPAGQSIADIDKAMDWLVSLIEEPKDRKTAREYVEQMSLDDIIEALGSMRNEKADPNS